MARYDSGYPRKRPVGGYPRTRAESGTRLEPQVPAAEQDDEQDETER